MAVYKQKLHHRIKAQPAAAASITAAPARGNPQPGAPSVSVPLGPPARTAAAMTGAHPAVPAPMVMPLTQVTVNPIDQNYVTLGVADVLPLTLADGAMVPATAPGRWDQLAQAGGGR